MLQLYAQKGATFSSLLASDITPPRETWTFADNTNEHHFEANHGSNMKLNFAGVTMKVNLTAELCQQGVDHLILKVEVDDSRPDQDCVLYNNYVAHPIVCSIDPGKFSSFCCCLHMCPVGGMVM